MTDDVEAAELAAQAMVFTAAAAVLSGGDPIPEATITLLRDAMRVESAPASLVKSLVERCREGLRAEDVPIHPALDEYQAALFATSIILFALRATPRGDPLDVASRLCAPYRVTREFVSAFARDLARLPEARRSSDTAESLRLLLEPPDRLVEALRAYRDRGRSRRPERRSMAHVSPARIQHPVDRAAAEALQSAFGFTDLVNFVMKHGLEKMQRVNNVGGKVRVGPKQFPGLYELYRGCVKRSGVTPEPGLFLENGSINAYTYGTDRPYIVLHTGAITLLSTAELEFVIGHELGHIRFEHVANLTVARLLPEIASLLPLGLGNLVSAGLGLALYKWSRNAELSADRMGLLVCQDPEAALRLMVKLSGVPAALYRAVSVEAFLEQYEEFAALDTDVTSSLAKLALTAYQDHPWTVVRAHELRAWARGGDYTKFVPTASTAAARAGAPQLPPGDALPFECPVCASVVAADARRCTTCGGPCTERDRFRRCVRCGAPGKPSLRFCEECGARQPTEREGAR